MAGRTPAALILALFLGAVLSGCLDEDAGPSVARRTEGSGEDGPSSGSASASTGRSSSPPPSSPPPGTSHSPEPSSGAPKTSRSPADPTPIDVAEPPPDLIPPLGDGPDEPGHVDWIGDARYLPSDAFEPTLGVTPEGVLWFSTFTPGSKRHVHRSDSDGLSWEAAGPDIAGLTYPPNSNDPFVHVDAVTGRVFVSDLQALMCSSLVYTDDEGESWTASATGCGLPPGVHDHQNVFTSAPKSATTQGYDNVVYYCVNRVADTACATSLDGGRVFGPLVSVNFLCGLSGHGVEAPDGTVYLPKACGDTVTVAVSRNDGLSWSTTTVDSQTTSYHHEVGAAVDSAGNVYAFWIANDGRPFLSKSDDEGRSWSKPIEVPTPGVAVTSFNAMAAGSDGRIVLAYYGTDAEKAYGDMDGGDEWNAYFAVSVNAMASKPEFVTVQLNDAGLPVGRGECTPLTRCNGVGDFIDVDIGPDGRPWAAMVDSASTVGGFAGTLCSGLRLLGPLEPLPPIEGGC